MSEDRLNSYKIMWLFTFFDLPTNTKSERRDAARFRKNLLQDGFVMMQYSVYTRHCGSGESADVHTRRVQDMVPSKGHVSILRITDKQYGNIINFWGAKSDPLPPAPRQLEFF